MKKHITLLISAAGLLLTACNGVLDKKPLVNLAVENYYTTEEQAYTAIIGLYHTIKIGEIGTYQYIHV